MPAAPLPPEQLAQAQALAEAIRQAIDAEVQALATTLVAAAAGGPFGATEFAVRDLAHKIAAKAIEQHLAQKKTATSGPA